MVRTFLAFFSDTDFREQLKKNNENEIYNTSINLSQATQWLTAHRLRTQSLIKRIDLAEIQTLINNKSITFSKQFDSSDKMWACSTRLSLNFFYYGFTHFTSLWFTLSFESQRDFLNELKKNEIASNHFYCFKPLLVSTEI